MGAAGYLIAAICCAGVGIIAIWSRSPDAHFARTAIIGGTGIFIIAGKLVFGIDAARFWRTRIVSTEIRIITVDYSGADTKATLALVK